MSDVDDVLNAERIRWARIQAAVGKPFVRIDSAWALNVPFWSRWLTQELKLSFDIVAQQLYRQNPGDLKVEPLTLDETIRLLTLGIQESMARAPEAPQLYPLDLPQVYRLLEGIKLTAAFAPASHRESLTGYAHRRLKYSPGSSLTTDELWADYGASRSKLALDPIPKLAFLGAIHGVIYEQFGCKRCGDIIRQRPDGQRTARRGFRNLDFRAPAKPVANEGEPVPPDAPTI